MIAYALLAAAAALFVSAAVGDVRSYRIPNALSLALAGLFAVYALAHPAGLPWPGHLAAGAVAFAVGAGLFHARVMGGGDVKLLAAAALWAGPQQTPALFVVMALAGGLLALAVLARVLLAAGRPALAPSGEEAASAMKVRVPYGVAIAAAALWTLAGAARSL